MKIVLLGPPGAGKGSLAGLIKEKLGVAHISTGDMLREEMKRGSALGLEIKGLIEKGALVSDEIVTRLVDARLSEKSPALVRGYMLDGFPRTVHQARDLDQILARTGQNLDFALNMDASVEVILMRLTGRRVCKTCGALFHVRNKPPKQEGVCDACGGALYQRSDDNETTIRHRLKVYQESTQPIVEFYRRSGRLKQVSGDQETVEAQDELLKILHEDQR